MCGMWTWGMRIGVTLVIWLRCLGGILCLYRPTNTRFTGSDGSAVRSYTRVHNDNSWCRPSLYEYVTERSVSLQKKGATRSLFCTCPHFARVQYSQPKIVKQLFHHSLLAKSLVEMDAHSHSCRPQIFFSCGWTPNFFFIFSATFAAS
jgi:hypothetical protein